MTKTGPLSGVKIIEFAGLGPGPFAAMLLSDMGAEILRIERPKTSPPTAWEVDRRGRHTIALDLKSPADIETCLELIAEADIAIEGNRPGVMERLGLGPDALLGRNPRLVFGRITGWGQEGPLALAAGHDINYLALTGALHTIGTEDKVVPPLNFVADYGGGAMFLVAGVLAALHHARATGEGQVVDAAMVDGAAYMASLFYGFRGTGNWSDRRADNLLDGGAPFYDTYQCADGKWVAVGALEPQFYALLVNRVGIEGIDLSKQMDQREWPALRAKIAEAFLTKDREQWCELLEGSDACFAPILSMDEAPLHPHNVARSTFVDDNGITRPAAAPRFSLTPAGQPGADTGHHETDRALAGWRGQMVAI
ncbi:CoA transferase (plasmid) [Sphingobium sp. JS3065]|uniref:CaiB/BaiF CoA transferase family protein n=1 Tax=Sphingobium sp. JS3065 TaxID=2970925 RepID=UPI002264C643|nr:CaiB/BaiF CoA-transferase family protein [Sphingobium sp. JS3065]UZW58279.1 CoA transferase [Sphingobium sp. JS3065]